MEDIAGRGAAEVAGMEEGVHDAAAEVDGEEADEEEGEEDESEDNGERRSGVFFRGERRVGEIGGHWPEKDMEEEGGGGGGRRRWRRRRRRRRRRTNKGTHDGVSSCSFFFSQ